MKQLYGRVAVKLPPPNYRKMRYERRMILAGIRPASIKRYSARAFPGAFALAFRREMERLVWDMKYRRLA